jgi:RNA polymerase sigma factor (sigma-70 family)
MRAILVCGTSQTGWNLAVQLCVMKDVGRTRLRLERRQPSEPRIALEVPEIDETWTAVCRLPFRLRTVLVLRFYQDLSEAGISDALGCRPGTVKSRLHRGLAKMREELS